MVVCRFPIVGSSCRPVWKRKDFCFIISESYIYRKHSVYVSTYPYLSLIQPCWPLSGRHTVPDRELGRPRPIGNTSKHVKRIELLIS